MHTPDFIRCSGLTVAGALVTSLFLAACSNTLDIPEPAVESAPPTQQARVVGDGEQEAQRREQERLLQRANQEAGLGAFQRQLAAGESPAEEVEADTIVVTGTRIRANDFSANVPTTVITGQQMQELGVVSVADMVNQLPGNTATVSPEATADSPFYLGASIANMRGLNTGFGVRTLTLIDSRRVAPTNNAGAVDMQFIPSALVGRIESLTGGASATYGADAMAGVVNVLVNGDVSVGGPMSRSPLSRVQPGEEVWVISQPSDIPQAQLMAQVADDALGSGAMIARFRPVIAHDDDSVERPQEPMREIPLPLKHTDVAAKISGYVGTVEVTQEFENPYDQKIEAVYMFPLPEKAAVSEFVMTVGERRIRGILREKEEAQAIYQQARAQGYQASLLTQHRPNVFEQKVANIEPGKQIDVNITYYETLAYQDGWYSFVFPTVVGPRYNPPGSADPLLALPHTEMQPLPNDAVRYLTPNMRSAHDISISMEIDAGVAIEEIESSHAIDAKTGRGDILEVSLNRDAVMPNRDFRLDFRVAGDTIKSNLLTYVDDETEQGYFTMMLYPPADLEKLERQPLELVFVLDCSGSMNGAPIEQAKAAIIAALDRLNPDDTFQIIRFSQSASQFGATPVAATEENIRQARRYVHELSGSGGTQMIEGIRAALGFPHDEDRLRFVTFLTDGFIGNEKEILGAIDESLGAARIFSFGVGSAPNHYLLERMAGLGRGAVAWLALDDSGREVMDAFFDRIAHPAMIDVEVDWGGMEVADVYPSRLPDLFVGRPVVVTGRFDGRPGDVRLEGLAGGEIVNVRLNRDRNSREHAFLPNLWARLKIAELNDQLAIDPQAAGPLGDEIRNTALAYSLMSDYTSFIAVDASQVTSGNSGATVYQAVPVPYGTTYETTVGR